MHPSQLVLGERSDDVSRRKWLSMEGDSRDNVARCCDALGTMPSQDPQRPCVPSMASHLLTLWPLLLVRSLIAPLLHGSRCILRVRPMNMPILQALNQPHRGGLIVRMPRRTACSADTKFQVQRSVIAA